MMDKAKGDAKSASSVESFSADDELKQLEKRLGFKLRVLAHNVVGTNDFAIWWY